MTTVAVCRTCGAGIMAVFGAPVALEDHAVRACRAALGIQAETVRLAGDVKEHDGLDLQLRVGLNSGEVVAGEIGSGAFGYAAIGEQVLGMAETHRDVGRTESNLVGRRWEMAAIEGVLDRAIDSYGAVVGVMGTPGIGKSRTVREVTTMAAVRGVDVFVAFCESHASDIPFYVVARLLRAAFGVGDLEAAAARAQVRARVPNADPEDVLLFDDLLGIAGPDVKLPKIDPDSRRRRLTALVNAASLARQTPAVYVVEDVHESLKTLFRNHRERRRPLVECPTAYP
jgi:hypothetical protein